MQKNTARVRRKLVVEGIIGLFIALSAIFFYIYKFIPPSESMEEWNFFGLTFTKNGYFSVQTAFYYYFTKIVPLYLFIIWFITCKHWWYHIILIPIAMYAFQLYAIFNEESLKVDENELFYLLIVCMIIIPIVYFVRIKLVDKYVHGIDLEAMDAELKTFKKNHPEENQLPSDREANQDHIQEDDEPQVGYQSFSDYLNSTFSTNNIERKFKRFQNNLRGWLHLKF